MDQKIAGSSPAPETMKKLTKENIKELNKGMELIKQNRCTKCGKKLKQVVDPIAKKKTGYLWYCECSPKIFLSKG